MHRVPRIGVLLLLAAFAWGGGFAGGPKAASAAPFDDPPGGSTPQHRKLSHEETLRWVADHRAWRLARKTRPIRARAVEPGEVGKEFQTADGVKEVAREGAWLSVGIAGEPWFQTLDKIEAKYDLVGEETKAFGFDVAPRRYKVYQPKPSSRNWVAQVTGPGIEGFTIKPGYDPERPLYSPAGGYVVRPDTDDPYTASPDDVWLVQKSLFESTYELIPAPEPAAGGKR